MGYWNGKEMSPTYVDVKNTLQTVPITHFLTRLDGACMQDFIVTVPELKPANLDYVNEKQ